MHMKPLIFTVKICSVNIYNFWRTEPYYYNSYYVISTRNNYSEFFTSNDVYFQRFYSSLWKELLIVKINYFKKWKSPFKPCRVQHMYSIYIFFYFLLHTLEESIGFEKIFIIRFLMDLHILICPEYDLTIFRKCHCMSECTSPILWTLHLNN